jgi:Raf kinase inhibitor-like YbhB/YbcL family protein
MKAFLSVLAFAMLSAASIHGAPETDLRLTSGDFTAGGPIPSRCTCDGRNESPSLRFAGLPERTQSLALILDDPDAPSGTFTHWLAWNIPPETKEFTAGSVPAEVKQGINDFGKAGYGGPCPPSGEHRYIFHLYALDFVPKLPAGTHRAALEAVIAGHVLGKTTLTSRYRREGLAK